MNGVMMNLFGVKTDIRVKSQKKHFNKIRPVIEEWLKFNRDYIELCDGGDNLYWYNERSTISSLAGAVWRCGGFAQEEYSAEKGEGDRNRSGRVDLYFHFNGLGVICEAKLLRLYFPKNNQKDFKKKIEESLESAIYDLKDTTVHSTYHDLGIALSFIVPYRQKDEDVTATKETFLKALASVDFSFSAMFELSGETMINGCHEYNEVVLIGKILKATQ